MKLSPLLHLLLVASFFTSAASAKAASTPTTAEAYERLKLLFQKLAERGRYNAVNTSAGTLVLNAGGGLPVGNSLLTAGVLLSNASFTLRLEPVVIQTNGAATIETITSAAGLLKTGAGSIQVGTLNSSSFVATPTNNVTGGTLFLGNSAASNLYFGDTSLLSQSLTLNGSNLRVNPNTVDGSLITIGGGTLGGSGTIGGTLTVGGTVSPGSSIGVTSGSLQLAGTGTTLGSLVKTGTGTLNLTSGNTLAFHGATIVGLESANTFTLAAGSIGTIRLASGNLVNYQVGSEGPVTLVPEPTSAALLLCGASALLWRRRAR